MMIPPLAVSTPPDDARQNPDEGFTEAMAAALAAVPEQTRWAATDTPTPVIPSMVQPVQIGQGVGPIAIPTPDPIAPGVIQAGSTEWPTAGRAHSSTVFTAVAPVSTTTSPTPDLEPAALEPIGVELVGGELGAVSGAGSSFAGGSPDRATEPKPQGEPVIERTAGPMSQTAVPPRDLSIRPDMDRAEPASLQTPSATTGATTIRPDPAVHTAGPEPEEVSLPSAGRPEIADHREDRRPIESQKSTPDLAVSGRSAAGFEMPPVESIGRSGPSVEESRAGRVPSAILQRVEEAVRALEHAPPPRSMTLAIDDDGLTRITVSLTTDGIRLSVPDGSQTSPRLLGDLEQALSSRGFDLSRDGRQGEQSRQEEAEGFVGSRPERRTSQDGVRL